MSLIGSAGIINTANETPGKGAEWELERSRKTHLIMEIKEGLHWDEINDTGLSVRFEREEWQALLRWQDRFKIPRGLNKTELNKLLKETQAKIDECKKRCRSLGPDNMILADIEREDYVEKKLKIKNILKMHDNFGSMNVQKAKQYPIDQIMEFSGYGFAKCLWHSEKTASMKLYKKTNRIKCFGCQINEDAIGVYMKLHGVDFNSAVKALS